MTQHNGLGEILDGCENCGSVAVCRIQGGNYVSDSSGSYFMVDDEHEVCAHCAESIIEGTDIDDTHYEFMRKVPKE